MRFLFISFIFLSGAVNAGYNSNFLTQLEGVYVYSDMNHIYIKTSTPAPLSANSTCSNKYIVVDGEISSDRRNAILSRLLLAYASKETINIGYDNAANCVGSYVRLYRAG